MVREIKFRGFNRKNGVWLYGFYLQNRGAHFIAPEEFADGKSWDDYEIDPETRGEYSGMKDEHGHEIFEGDVIECGANRYVCEFTEGGFEFRDLSYDWLILRDIVIRSRSRLHVIGNIHDNPELIEL